MTEIKRHPIPDFPGLEMEGGRVFYYDKEIGTYHRCNSNYPCSVENIHGKSVGFASDKDAFNFLIMSSKSKPLDANIFPDDIYILRVHELALEINPEPNAPIRISAKIHYNMKKSTGSSAASKPTNAEFVMIDLDKKTIETKKNLVFVNQNEIINKIKKAVEEMKL